MSKRRYRESGMQTADIKADAERFWALRPAADAAEKIVPLAVSQIGVAFARSFPRKRSGIGLAVTNQG